MLTANDTQVDIDAGPPDRRSARACLIATDGRRSPLRAQAGIKVVRWPHDQIGIVTRVHHERPHNGRAVQHFLPGGPFAILPMRDQRSCITWTEERVRGEAILSSTIAASSPRSSSASAIASALSGSTARAHPGRWSFNSPAP